LFCVFIYYCLQGWPDSSSIAFWTMSFVEIYISRRSYLCHEKLQNPTKWF
jgi:hypothetical protein